jgi:hypothetical protein
LTVLTELYVNAMDHGLLGLNSALKGDAAGFAGYFTERERRMASLAEGHIALAVSCEGTAGGQRQLRIRIEDSGPGFDTTALDLHEDDPLRLHGRGIVLVRRLCTRLDFRGRGNLVEAVFPIAP